MEREEYDMWYVQFVFNNIRLKLYVHVNLWDLYNYMLKRVLLIKTINIQKSYN